MTLERLQQEYTKINRRLYKYEKLPTGYQAQCEVDEFEVIVSYGNLWHRVADR